MSTAKKTSNNRVAVSASAAEQNTSTTEDSNINVHHQPPQRTKAKDPFLFYSNIENLERARSLTQEVDYSTKIHYVVRLFVRREFRSRRM